MLIGTGLEGVVHAVYAHGDLCSDLSLTLVPRRWGLRSPGN